MNNENKKDEKKGGFGKTVLRIMISVLVTMLMIPVTIVLVSILGLSILAPEVMIPLIAITAIILLPGIITGIVVAKKI